MAVVELLNIDMAIENITFVFSQGNFSPSYVSKSVIRTTTYQEDSPPCGILVLMSGFAT